MAEEEHDCSRCLPVARQPPSISGSRYPHGTQEADFLRTSQKLVNFSVKSYLCPLRTGVSVTTALTLGYLLPRVLRQRGIRPQRSDLMVAGSRPVEDCHAKSLRARPPCCCILCCRQPTRSRPVITHPCSRVGQPLTAIRRPISRAISCSKGKSRTLASCPRATGRTDLAHKRLSGGRHCGLVSARRFRDLAEPAR